METRTDLAVELQESCGKKQPEGVKNRSYFLPPVQVTETIITDTRGEALLHRPKGTYLTAEPQDQATEYEIALALAELLRQLIPPSGTVFVCGLGNRAVTPDALGPVSLDRLIVTRHLISSRPDLFGGMRPVCALAPGVLGDTGVETLEWIRGVTKRVSPAAIVAVDALAARSYRRLCNTFQLTDTGIIPGSGACNARRALNRENLGVPVIAFGVPTVIGANTLVSQLSPNQEHKLPTDFLVAPKDIDRQISRCGRIIGWALDFALQGKMSLEEISEYFS